MKNKCKCTPEQTTGNTEFQRGILSCNICGMEVESLDKAILHLNLKKRWYDMIFNEEKKEEYREIKPYWTRIFGSTYITIKKKPYHPKDVLICFSNGYGKNRSQMFVEVIGMRTKEGKKEWGAEPGHWYYTLILGEINPGLPF